VKWPSRLCCFVGTGLFVRTFVNLLHVDPGYRSDNLLTSRVSLPVPRYPDRARRVQVQRDLLERIPGWAILVSAAAVNGDCHGNPATKAQKIIVNIATSADGYIARPDGDIEWLTRRPPPKGFYGMGTFMQSVDTKLLCLRSVQPFPDGVVQLHDNVERTTK
jgi:hypothetical protein